MAETDNAEVLWRIELGAHGHYCSDGLIIYVIMPNYGDVYKMRIGSPVALATLIMNPCQPARFAVSLSGVRG
jgi:hypothetical protein